MPSFVLDTPGLHQLMSRRYLLLTFTGRRSGRSFRIPVAYARHGDRLVISTDSPWWRNLVANPGVRLRLQGQDRDARATLVADEDAAVERLLLLTREVPGYHRPAGLRRVNGQVTQREAARAVRDGRRVIEFEVTW